MTKYKIYTLSPAGERDHIIAATDLTDAFAQARAAHAEAVGDTDPDAVYVTERRIRSKLNNRLDHDLRLTASERNADWARGESAAFERRWGGVR